MATYSAEDCHNINADGSYDNTEIKIHDYNDETGNSELVNVTKYIYKLDPSNIKDGDYLYVVRQSEANDVWVLYTHVGSWGRALYEYKDEDDDLSSEMIHHNCLALPDETAIMAGEIIVREHIIYVNCSSGHYKPDPNKRDIILNLLYDKFNTHGYTVKYYKDCDVPFEHRSSTYATTALTFSPSSSGGRKRKTSKRINKKDVQPDDDK